MKDHNKETSASNTLTWPGFIKFDGDNGLLYIQNEQQWLADAGLHSARYEAQDKLIDSTGAIFSLSQNTNGQYSFVNTHKVCSIADAIGYVQAYAVEENYCCSAKIFAQSFDEILSMICDLDKEG